MKARTLLWGVGLLALGLSACQSEKIDNTMIVPPATQVSYADDIQPIFTQTCGGGACHVGQSTNGVNLTTHAQVMASNGVRYGAIVVANDPDNSPLLDKISAQPQFGSRMPLGRTPLSGTQVSLIREWIADGAPNN